MIVQLQIISTEGRDLGTFWVSSVEDVTKLCDRLRLERWQYDYLYRAFLQYRDDPPDVVEFASPETISFGNCCDDPRPRIGEASGRVFCATCRSYLDARPDPAQSGDKSGPSGPQATESGNRTSPQGAGSPGLGDDTEGDRT